MHIPLITSFEVVGSPILLYHHGQRACPLCVAASSRSLRLFLRQFLCWLLSLRLPPKSCWDADRMPERRMVKKGKHCEQNKVRLVLINAYIWRVGIGGKRIINKPATHVKSPPEFSIPTTLYINSLVNRQPNQVQWFLHPWYESSSHRIIERMLGKTNWETPLEQQEVLCFDFEVWEMIQRRAWLAAQRRLSLLFPI